MDIDIHSPEGLADLRKRVTAEIAKLGFDISTPEGRAGFAKYVEQENDAEERRDRRAFDAHMKQVKAEVLGGKR